jgi:ribonuclease D
LRTELEEKGRLSWVREECEYLSKVRPNTNNTEPLYLHFKGAGKLDPRSLAVLEALLQSRRRIARKKDKPLFRIFGNRSLLDLAEKKPENFKQLEKTAALSPRQMDMHGRKVIAAIVAARKIPVKDLPVYPRKRAPRIPLRVAERIKALRRWRDQQVKKLAIDPALICTKSLISEIATQKPDTFAELAKVKGLKNWQRKEFGSDILDVLRGMR